MMRNRGESPREIEALRYSRRCRQRRRAQRSKMLRISFLVVTLAALLLICCLAACHQSTEALFAPSATITPELEPELTPTQPPKPTQELTPTLSPVSTPEPVIPSEGPARHRDDIVTQGRFLSYELQEVMQDCCDEYEVPYALALAMAEVESHFDPDAVSTVGDYGLMQINQINHEWLREIGLDPLTYAGNIEAGIYIISSHLKTYEDTELALMAYNSGPTGAQKLWDVGTYHTDYSCKVMAAFERWTSVLEE